MEVDGERVWAETPDVGNDNDTHFPVVGPDFERRAGIRPSQSPGFTNCWTRTRGPRAESSSRNPVVNAVRAA